MKIAVIGAGISGLTCAHYLAKDHEITLFEANDYLGGHTATVDVMLENGQKIAVDTGFIVFNDRTYSKFRQLLSELGVGEQATEMSFSVKNPETGLEYNGHSLWRLFAQKRNLFNPRFYVFLKEIVRFNREARKSYAISTNGSPLVEQTLGDFLELHQFDDFFGQNYILPMGAAIWSSTLSDMRAFPLKFFLRFFYHHGLLEISNRPQWFVIPNGSREYVKKIQAGLNAKVRMNTPVERVVRHADRVDVFFSSTHESFDQVIFANHSDQALASVADPSSKEKQLLGKMRYQANDVVLHTDHALLPKRKAAWASWNYCLGEREDRETRLATLTYNMNILQNLDVPQTLCVSLNATDRIDPDKILRRFTYHHPVFNQDMIDSQQNRHLVSGVNRTWYCGSYWYNGFHEDGVRSALDVVNGIETIVQLEKRGTFERVS